MDSRVRRYAVGPGSDSPGTSLEITLSINRPPEIWSMVASCRASWGTTISPMRTASRRLMCRVWVATAAAKATLSMPSA